MSPVKEGPLFCVIAFISYNAIFSQISPLKIGSNCSSLHMGDQTFLIDYYYYM